MENDDNDKLIFSSFRELLSATPDLIFIKDMDLRYRMISDSFVNIIGCDSKEDLIGKTAREIFPDQAIASRFLSRDKLVIEGQHHSESYYELIPRLNGGQAYISVHKSLLFDADHEPLGILCIGQDMTREYESKLLYNSEIQSLFAMSPDCMLSMILDLTTWRIIHSALRMDLQRYCYNLTGIEEFKASALKTSAGSPDMSRWLHSLEANTMLHQYNDGKRSFSLQYRISGISEQPKWVKLKARLLMDPLSGHLTMVCQLIDIDAAVNASGQLKRAAECDSMTGLYNHDATLKHISNYLASEGFDGVHALLMVDIDNFKSINDRYGHQTGDDVLIHIAGIIRKTFRADDIIGRIGGDEFMILMKNCGTLDTADRKVCELVENLRYNFTRGRHIISATGSVGVSLYESDGRSIDQLYYEADSALYKVKASGKNGSAFAEAISADYPLNS